MRKPHHLIDTIGKKMNASCRVHIYCLGLNVRDEFIWGWQIHYVLKGAREMSVACVREKRKRKRKSSIFPLDLSQTSCFFPLCCQQGETKTHKQLSAALWIKVLPSKKGTQKSPTKSFFFFYCQKDQLKNNIWSLKSWSYSKLRQGYINVFKEWTLFYQVGIAPESHFYLKLLIKKVKNNDKTLNWTKLNNCWRKWQYKITLTDINIAQCFLKKNLRKSYVCKLWMHSFLKTLKHKLMYSEYLWQWFTLLCRFFWSSGFQNSKDNFHMFLLNIEHFCDT